MPEAINMSNRINTLGLIAIALLLAFGLSSCATQGEDARSLLDRIEFGEDEIGCVDIRGEISLNPSVIFSKKATIILKKSKGENPTEC